MTGVLVVLLILAGLLALVGVFKSAESAACLLAFIVAAGFLGLILK